MATREEIIAGLEKVRSKFTEEKIKKEFASFSKTFEYSFKDLGISFHIVIKNGVPGDLQNNAAGKPDIQLTMDSRTFLEIMDGRTNGMKAYTSGKVKIKGSVTDMIKLQKLM